MGSPALSLLFGEDEPTTATPVAGPRGLDLMLGDEKPPELTAKDLKHDPKRTLSFGQQAALGFAPDDEAWLKGAAQRLYPGEPLAASRQRFGRTSDGRAYHKDDSGAHMEVESPTFPDRLANVGAGVGKMLPIGGGIVGTILGAPAAATGVGVAGTVAAGAGGAALGEGARQLAGRAILGADVAENPNALAIATEGLTSGLGAGVGAGFGSWASRYAVPDIAQFSAKATNDLLAKAQQAGIRLTPAEATGLESLTQEQKRLMAVPQSANEMRKFFAERNEEVLGAWRQNLNALNPPGDAGRVGQRAAASAKDIVQSRVAERTGIAEPYYKQAFAENTQVRPGDVHTYLETELQHAKGPMRSTLEKIQGYLRTSDGKSSDRSLQGLDNAKKAIDQLEASLMSKEGGIDASTRYAVDGVRRRLIDAMDQAEGGSGVYARGRQAYERLTKMRVEPAKEAVAPLLNIRDTNPVRAAQAILDPATRSPELVTEARKLFQQAGAKAEWDGLVRQFLQEEVAGALKVSVAGELRNVGGKIASKMDEGTMGNLQAAMLPAEFAKLKDLLEVFRATGRALDQNTDTAFKMQAIERAKNAAGGGVARVARNLNPIEWPKHVAEFFANKNYERQAEALAKIYTSGDPKMIAQLRQLKRYEPGDFKRVAIIGQLLTQAGVEGGEAALAP